MRHFIASLLISLASAAGLASQAAAQIMSPTLSAESAQTIVTSCEAFAVENDLRVVIAVYDEAGNLKAFLRMDGARLGSIDIAHWKGRSSASFNRSTAEIAAAAESNPALYETPGLSTLRGGVAIWTPDGAALGGVGVSGASSLDDQRCAAAGIEAAGLETRLPEAE